MSKKKQHLHLEPLYDLPEITADHDLAELVFSSATAQKVCLDHSIVVIAQKVVSKAEKRVIALDQVRPGEQARNLAAQHDKDPRLVEVILQETRRLIRAANGVLICETHHGWICANAGVDCSNTAEANQAILLPKDADASAMKIRQRLIQLGAIQPAVLISDTWGRPWREGLVDVAIGCAGMDALSDQRGGDDRRGRELQVTRMATADQVTAAAGILMQKAAGIPIVIVTGIELNGNGNALPLQRDPRFDLFRD